VVASNYSEENRREQQKNNFAKRIDALQTTLLEIQRLLIELARNRRQLPKRQ
jgi:hypothetical protein